MGNYDFEIKQGIKLAKTVYWKSSSNRTYTLTGWSAKMQMRRTFDDNVIVELSSDNGKIVITPDLGKIVINMTDSETSALNHKDFPCVYDLELTNSTGDVVKRLLEGTIKLSREATK